MHESSATLPSHSSDLRMASLLAVSASAVQGGEMGNEEFFLWLSRRQADQAQIVSQIPFDDLNGWSFDAGTGDLHHRSGRFFSVRGLRVRSDFGPVREWSQPIITQPEIGILGIAVREINGVLHLLMQAKSEPGNVNGVQLSPTVQATKSNYTGVHGGSAVRYIEYFRDPPPGSVVADVLQSEQGSWFLHKRNRNMVVEVGPEVEAGEDFCWLTLGQVNALLRHDNLVNMDARTVLSCLPDWRQDAEAGPGLHTDVEIRSWITRRRAEHEVSAELVPLDRADGWKRGDMEVAHERGLYFSVIGVDVSSHRREVAAWSQPLLAPHGQGVVALLVKRIGGVLHGLFQARVEPGFLDVVELGATVQCTPENYAHLPPEDRPAYLDEALGQTGGRRLYDTVLSEEGGRFHHAQSRYLIVEVDDDFALRPPADFRWLGAPRLGEPLKYSHHLNVQARTLVAALRTL